MNLPASAPPSNVRGRRWLVLGASGFVGSATLAELNAQNRPARAVGHAAQPGGRLAVEAFDTDGLRRLLRDWPPDVLLNAVGHPGDLPESGLADFYGRSTACILSAVQAEMPACRVILLGSAAEYGNSPASPGSTESDLLRPLSDYGRAKCVQGQVAGRFAAAGLRLVTARLFNPIGPGQGTRQLAGALCARIDRGERPLRVVCGSHVRDWIDIRDAARALVLLGDAPAPPPVVNICTGQGHTVGCLATELARLAGVPLEIEPGEVSPDLLWHSLGQPNRLQALGWRPRHAFLHSLASLCPTT